METIDTLERERILSVIEKDKKDTQIRSTIVGTLLPIFVSLNRYTVLFLVACLLLDVLKLYTSEMPFQPIVTSSVVSTLVGATTVQLGAVMWMVGRYFFSHSSAIPGEFARG